MKVKVKSDECIGCAACTAVCPNVFEMSDEGFATAKVAEVAEGDKAAVEEAKDGCPVSAIEVNE